jgi:hypothetical protein
MDLPPLQHFNSNGVDALGYENVQRIIHKPVPGDPRQTRKLWAGNAHAEMRPVARITGTCMPSMGGALVNHLQLAGL